MSSSVLSFPAADSQQWQDLVSKALDEGSPANLYRTDEDGLEIALLYQIGLVASGSKDQVPSHRLTANPAQRLAYGWRICQPVDGDAAPETVNSAILNELSGGASGVYFKLGLVSANHLKQMMHNVVLEAADIVLDAGANVSDVLAAFENFVHGQGKKLSNIRLDLAIDPFAPESDDAVLKEGLQLLGRPNDNDIAAGVFRLNGWSWHNQGLTAVQELAYLLTSATQIFRSGTRVGLSAMQVAQKTSMSLALPADMFDGIAKCRALRRCWIGLMNGLGLDATICPLQLQALPSMRMFNLIDADTNILRTTTALLGGAIGGADMMTSFAHDALTGGSEVGRRLARMQQVIMVEESGLGRCLDAAGGAAFIEARTEALANAAWTAFQGLEAAGGAVAAKADQTFALMAQAAAVRREQKLVKGAQPLLGVTLQPNNQPVEDPVPRWQNISRPAALVETIRRQIAKAPPRILILQHGDAFEPQLDAIKQVLRIGGMSAVHLTLPLDQEDAVKTASPKIVILLNSKKESLESSVRRQLDNSVLVGGIFEADEILHSTAQLQWLIKLAQMTEDLD